MKPLLEVRNLKVYFPLRRGLFGRVVGYVKAVDGVSFAVNKGQIYALVGESGCGKSTVLRAILRLVDVYSGKIIFDGVDVTSKREQELKWYRQRVQAVFQNPQASLNPLMLMKTVLSTWFLLTSMKITWLSRYSIKCIFSRRGLRELPLDMLDVERLCRVLRAMDTLVELFTVENARGRGILG